MARYQERLFIGIGNVVLALDPKDGSELWRTKLKSAGFVNVMWDGELLLAASGGEVFRIDPQHGAIIWQNKLKGLGMGIVTFASSRQPGNAGGVPGAEQSRRNAAAAGAASA
jgi:outer membrane protein assembly factor BamB